MKAGAAIGMALRLAKAGYWNGDPCAIMRAPADLVSAAIQYENFCGDYERATFEMSKEQNANR